jgi:opacity protein-like surface antigen
MLRRSLSTLAALVACSLFAAPAAAEMDLGFKGIGPTITYVTPEDIDGTIGFGALADLGRITPLLGLEATLDFWSKSEDAGSLEVKFRDISLGARAMYHFPVEGSKFDPSIGAGIALHLFRSEVPEQVIGGLTFGGDDSETRIGFDLAGQVGYALTSNVDLRMLTGYRIVEDVGQFAIGAGVIFGLGQ